MNRFILTLLVLTFASCEKEVTGPPAANNIPPFTNLPPVAVGGTDRTITLPDTTDVILDGTRSYDPDGIKLTLNWTQISGPPTSQFVDSYTRLGDAYASFSTGGKYLFQLTAKDERFTTYDTVEVIVRWAPHCNTNREMVSAEQVSVSQSPKMISYASTLAIGNDQLVFAGGPISEPFWPDDPPTAYSSWIHLYDMKTNAWSEWEMFQARGSMGAVVAGNKLFLAGGVIQDGSITDEVEIHDLNTKKIERARLSMPRISLSVATVGNKVVFAGGVHKNDAVDVVDIYDLSTGSWSTAKLSQPRVNMATMASGTRIYFIGGSSFLQAGFTNTIDIYDAASGTWSVHKMKFDGSALQTAVFGDKMVIAGGVTGQDFGVPSSRVEFVNLSDWSSTTDCNLFTSYSEYGPQKGNMNIAVLGDKIYLGNYDHISEYNSSDQKWKHAKVQTHYGLLYGYQGNLYGLRFAYGQDGNGQYAVIRVRF